MDDFDLRIIDVARKVDNDINEIMEQHINQPCYSNTSDISFEIINNNVGISVVWTIVRAIEGLD